MTVPVPDWLGTRKKNFVGEKDAKRGAWYFFPALCVPVPYRTASRAGKAQAVRRNCRNGFATCSAFCRCRYSTVE